MLNVEEILKVSQTLSLLYVEDNKEARESTYGLLSNLFSTIVVAVDGEEALEKFYANRENFDLIITDINMPKMDGVKFIQEVRKENKKIKIYILSAYNEIEYTKNLEDDIDAYLYKPININKLFEALQSMFS